MAHALSLDHLDDPSPPTFGPDQLEDVLGRVQAYERRRQRAVAITSTVAAAALVAISLVTVAADQPSDTPLEDRLEADYS